MDVLFFDFSQQRWLLEGERRRNRAGGFVRDSNPRRMVNFMAVLVGLPDATASPFGMWRGVDGHRPGQGYVVGGVNHYLRDCDFKTGDDPLQFLRHGVLTNDLHRDITACWVWMSVAVSLLIREDQTEHDFMGRWHFLNYIQDVRDWSV